MDGRISTVLFESDFSITLEGLLTSANMDAPKNHFYSIVAFPYLLTIFTSDGADDSPGATKPAGYGKMDDEHGLQVGVISLNYNISRKATLLLRAGYLQKAFQPNGLGQKVGQEYDLEYTYQLSPSSQLQLDYAYAEPGAGISTQTDFQLISSKIKFSF